MTQPTPTTSTPAPNFSGHSITPDIGFDPTLVPTRAVILPGAKPDTNFSQTAKDLSALSDRIGPRQTIGIEQMQKTLRLEPQWPADLEQIAPYANFLWRSDDGLLIDEIGVHFVDADGREHTKVWKCGGTAKAALAQYTADVFPYLRKVFDLEAVEEVKEVKQPDTSKPTPTPQPSLGPAQKK